VPYNLVWNCDWSAIIVLQVCMWCNWDTCESIKVPINQ